MVEYKSIKVTEEQYNKLKELDNSISKAISILLLGRTDVEQKGQKVEQNLNLVEQGRIKVEQTYTKEEINKVLFDKLQKIRTEFNRFRELDKEELRNDILNLQRRNGLK